MQILLKHILLAQESSPKPVNLLVDRNREVLVSILEDDAEADQVYDFGGQEVFAAPGWIDLFASCGEPGEERSQDLDSLAVEAGRGGYCQLVLHPHHAKQFETEAEILAVSFRNGPIKLSVAAPLSEGLKGKKLLELRHLTHAGALAFSDGYRYEGDTAFYSQALQYGKSLNRPIFIRPDASSFSQSGQAYEGEVSSITGLMAVLPNLEEMVVHQYLTLARQTGTRIHFTCLTDPASVMAVLQGREEGLSATFDVSSAHLAHDEREYEQFDSAFKVYPFLRSKEKVEKLRTLVKQHLPAIVSNHRPTTPEGKDTDFTNAEFGAKTIERAAWGAIAACTLTAHEAYLCLHDAPAQILGQAPQTLLPGSPLNFNLFTLRGFETPKPILGANKPQASPLLARFFKNSMTFHTPSLFQ